MILKSLEMDNIRSYVNQKIIFPLGTTLFEGDIGSGKSTILNAIEFALFGLGSQRGGSLLRLGAKSGSVTLTFEVDGKEYRVHRSLIRKTRYVRQGDDGYVETGGSRLSLSATELKERILSILQFNEPPDPKAQSVIYRYAVFTPQEEMKAILTQDPDERLQTLRKAFGVEDYKIAGENVQNISRAIKHRSNFLDGQVSDLGQKEDLLKQTRDEIQKLQAVLTGFKKKEEAIDRKLSRAEERLDKLQKTKRKIERIKAQMPHYEKEIGDKNKLVDNLTQENNQLNTKIMDNQPTIDKLAKLECPTHKSENELEEELEKAESEDKEIRRQEAQIEAKVNDYKSIEKNGVCPTCDRPADSEEFQQKIEEKTKAREKLSKRIRDHEKLIEELDHLRLKLKDYVMAQNELKRLREQLDEWNDKIRKNNEEIKRLTEEIEEAKNKLNSALKAIRDLETVSKKIEMLEGEKDRIEADLKSVREEVNTRTGRINALEETVNRLKEEVDQKKEQKKKRDRLIDHQIWLSDYFIPTLEIIERHVMVSINREFDQQFQRWFNIMIDDPDLAVRIDEDFTPLVERNGYDQDLTSLSGGEKTSVALAYRLALNTLVQSISTGMKSNLLILDEPTDGFSKEQLFRMRDILAELRCPQTIIVSHEKELESFADYICTITKTQGKSTVGSANRQVVYS